MIPCKRCLVSPELVEEARGEHVFYRYMCPKCGFKTSLHKLPVWAYRDGWEPANRM